MTKIVLEKHQCGGIFFCVLLFVCGFFVVVVVYFFCLFVCFGKFCHVCGTASFRSFVK